jgi:hypothetical protein
MERNRFVHILAFIDSNISQTKTIPDPQPNPSLSLRGRSQPQTRMIRSRAIDCNLSIRSFISKLVRVRILRTARFRNL